MNYRLILGLETHIELTTKQKMFCGCSAQYFGQPANLNVCPVCLGLPGALPVPNRQAVEWTILIALALNCQINQESFFERKHYFYPDLPKGYQISQYQKPFGYNGYLDIGHKKIRIERVHLEEDTGKLIHTSAGDSLVDYNRSSVPLVEIVTYPDFDNSADAVSYLKLLQQTIRYLGVSTADMEKGSMRAEPNISLVESQIWNKDHQLPKYKVEVKNINSFRFVKKAVDFEFERQQLLLSRQETPVQETRRYQESTGKTVSMRSKENAHDYRYFPEPDIPPIILGTNELEAIKKQLSQLELPRDRQDRLVNELQLPVESATLLTENRELGDQFFALVKKLPKIDPKQIANLLVNRKIDTTLPMEKLVVAIGQQLTKTDLNANELAKTVTQVINNNPQAVKDYQAGKNGSIQFLLGQTLRIVGRQVDVPTVMAELQQQLSAK